MIPTGVGLSASISGWNNRIVYRIVYADFGGIFADSPNFLAKNAKKVKNNLENYCKIKIKSRPSQYQVKQTHIKHARL